jgi:myo-inositol 2-dehydrogenase / D-chiro-inositol 1-dehydrogenase
MNHRRTRRNFLGAAAGAASFMIVKPESVRGAPENSRIELGIIGCGGRGRFIADKFNAGVGGDIKFVAAHDAFEDRLESLRGPLKIEKSRSSTGLLGYRDLLASKVDAVIITSPPYFHPQQAADAVAAGKHVWLAKPVGIDVPGCLSVKETGRRAGGKVAFLVDFQSRNSPFFLEAKKRVDEGAVGEVFCGEAFNQFGCGGWWDAPRSTPGALRLRNWGTDPVLSGDIIVEQAVHAMDIVNWLIGRTPVKAFGTGGLKARLGAGKNWDHFVVTYWYGDGIQVDLNCSQFMRGYENLGARLFGKLGTVHAHYCGPNWGTGPVKITGDRAWEGTPRDNTWDIGVDRNARDFVAAIRSGNLMNHADHSADSALTSILGRKASYEERVVTWDELLKEGERLEAKIEL